MNRRGFFVRITGAAAALLFGKAIVKQELPEPKTFGSTYRLEGFTEWRVGYNGKVSQWRQIGEEDNLAAHLDAHRRALREIDAHGCMNL